ncbi:MAG: hypothetical protein FIA92_11480, partial [Chloroflexi bacterium]|nr:hypothetical protein [Chloroflexota bacterium]
MRIGINGFGRIGQLGPAAGAVLVEADGVRRDPQFPREFADTLDDTVDLPAARMSSRADDRGFAVVVTDSDVAVADATVHPTTTPADRPLHQPTAITQGRTFMDPRALRDGPVHLDVDRKVDVDP